MGKKSPLRATSPVWPFLAIAILLAGQATMLATRAINWDEFFYYSQVAEFVRGELVRPLQTFHVHLFAWLPQFADNSVDGIVIARIFMFACELATIAAIYAVARRFADRATAAIAALCYISAGYVLQHGFSFRVDPGATALLMGALAILARTRLSAAWLLAFAMLVGVAGVITIKIVLFAPAFAGLMYLRWAETRFSRAMLLRLVAGSLAALAAFGLLYLWHSHGLAGSEGAAGPAAQTIQESGRNTITSSGNSVFFLGVPPYWNMIVKSASLAMIFTVLILIAPFAVSRARALPAERIALAGLWLPILTLAFYRNTAPYYYAFIFAPVAVGCVPAMALALKRVPALVLSAVLTLLALPVFLNEDRNVIDHQREVVRTAESLFDTPVDYFDHNGMLAAHRKANGFMTPWGLEGYLAADKSHFRSALERRPVPLLLENDPLLRDVLHGESAANPLLPEDRRVLRDNFVPVWGPIWLAGKDVPAGTDEISEVLVPGRYRVEGSDIALGGEPIASGSVVMLGRGEHRLANASAETARLIWADANALPSSPPPSGRIWIGF